MEKYFRDVNEIIEEVKKDYKAKFDEELGDVEISYNTSIYSFPQTWPSTALGFGGYGGQTVTWAQTTVIEVDTIQAHYVAVFFGGRFAYSIADPNENFFKDVRKFHMEPIYKTGKYLWEHKK